MLLFICRWQNGDFSTVSASSKRDLIELLAEVGNAETSELFTMKNFRVHFSTETGDVVAELIRGGCGGYRADFQPCCASSRRPSQWTDKSHGVPARL